MNDLLGAEHLLMQEVFKNAEMNALVNLSAKLIDNPVAFYLLNFTELVYSDNYPKEVAEDLIICRERSTPDELLKWTEIFNNSIVQCKPIAQSWPYMRYRHLVCGSSINGSLIGYITLPQIESPLEELDFRLVELIAKIYGIALLIKEDSHIKNSEHSLLWGLLTDRINSNYLRRNILYPAFGSVKEYRMLWFLSHDTDGKALTDLDVHELLLHFKNKWNILFEEGYAVLTDGVDESQLEQLDPIAKKKQVLIGVSDVFSSLEHTKKNFIDAQYALRYSMYLEKTSGIARFDDYKLFHLISMAQEHFDLSEYTTNCIKNMEKHDLKNNTEYLVTLRAYFRCNRNIDEMAKKLFIHKNTVLYRVKRLQELFHIDLDNCYQMSSLVCSVLIHDNIIN